MSETVRLQEIEALLDELRSGRLSPILFREALAEKASGLEALEEAIEQVGFPEELEDSPGPALARGRHGLALLREGMARMATPGDEALQSGLDLVRLGGAEVAEVVACLRKARVELERRRLESGQA